MANLQGYTSVAVGNMLNHYTRHGGDPDQSKWQYGNIRIDKSRTHLNYAIFERDDPAAFIAVRVAEADTRPTKATNVISDWIVTLPKNEQLAGREREFFEAVYDFLKAYVGEENIVGAWVHLDETSPHLHFCFVPLTEQTVMTNDKSQPLRWTERDEAKNPEHRAGEVKRDKKGTVRYKRVIATDDEGNPVVKKTISQSKVFDRTAMRDFHPQLSAYMRERFGFDVGVELEDEGDKVLSKLEHSEYIAAKTTLKKTKAEVERVEDKRREIREQAAQEQDRLERLQQARGATAERVEALEAVAAECRAADAAPVSQRGALLDRIAALCARWVERLGGFVDRAAGAAKRALAIDVRHAEGAGASLHERSSKGIAAVHMDAPPRQLQRTYTPQL